MGEHEITVWGSTRSLYHHEDDISRLIQGKSNIFTKNVIAELLAYNLNQARCIHGLFMQRYQTFCHQGLYIYIYIQVF